ncbi:hypothetical protein PLESTM_001494400 [Pleodorina starrii]|nr:hypothetical protein PLESTM_001494400 [Pleodorina starrii]
MAASMEGCRHPGSGILVGGRKDRRASLVIQATAAQLADLHADANRSSALMSELEMLLSASQAASGSVGSVFASANFIAAQPLELSDPDDDDDVDNNAVQEYDEDAMDAAIEDLSRLRLKTLISKGRTSSVITVGGGSGVPDGPLFISGTHASMSARPGYAPPSPLTYTAAAADSNNSRRSLSNSNMRAASFNAARSGPSQNGLKSVNSSGPPSGAAPRNNTHSGCGDSPGREPHSPRVLQAPAAGSGERRSTFFAWVSSRSPTRRSSRTTETPAAAAPPPPPPPPQPLVAHIVRRRSSTRDVTAAPVASTSPTPRSPLRIERRASSTSYGSFLPRLGHRESDSSGAALYGSGGGGGNGTSFSGGGSRTSNSGTGSGGGAAPSGTAAGGGGGLSVRWGGLIGSTRSARTLKG